MRRILFVVMIAVGALFPTAIAGAHSALSGSTPKEGERVAAPPESITLEFTEPPISADNLVVKDGCKKDVVASAEVEQKTIVAELASGQPGRWKVSSRVISVVDGHETTDSFTFNVRGRADCDAAADDGPGPRENDNDGGSVTPVILAVGGATVVAAALAFLLRRGSQT